MAESFIPGLATTSETPVPAGARTLVEQARTTWAEAVLERSVAERYRGAHLAALRAAAAVIAMHARPADKARRRPTSAWVLLVRMAPELSDWAAYFADSAGKRAAIELGATSAVSEREADDLLRAAGEFVALVERHVGLRPMGLAS